METWCVRDSNLNASFFSFRPRRVCSQLHQIYACYEGADCESRKAIANQVLSCLAHRHKDFNCRRDSFSVYINYKFLGWTLSFIFCLHHHKPAKQSSFDIFTFVSQEPNQKKKKNTNRQFLDINTTTMLADKGKGGYQNIVKPSDRVPKPSFTDPAPPKGNEFGGSGSEASGSRGGHTDTTGNANQQGGHPGGGGFGVHGGSDTGQSANTE